MAKKDVAVGHGNAVAADAVCTNCGSMFLANRGWQKFCSKQCYYQHHTNRRRDALALLRINERLKEQQKREKLSVSLKSKQ